MWDRCALTTHVTNNNHSINYDNVKILESEINTNKRLILAMYQIHKSPNTFNKKLDTQNVIPAHLTTTRNF